MSRSSQVRTSLLDKVEECSLLHSGGEADVYKVSIAGKSLVLKWYKPGCSFDASVLDVVAKSNVPGHFQLREYGVRHERSTTAPYLLYDFIDGSSSDQIQKMSLPVALYALRRIALTLGALRKNQVSHGDLSPSNIVFAEADTKGYKDLQPVVIDFGIVGPGSLAYAAPERFHGSAPTEKSDLFSLGLLLYRWIAGEDLIQARNYEEFAALSSTVDASRISEMLFVKGTLTAQELRALEPLWNGLLHVDPQKRLEDLDELEELLEIALDQVSGGQVSLIGAVSKFVSLQENEKAGEKVPTPEKCDLPYVIYQPTKKNSLGKIFVFAISGLILLVVALWLAFGTKGADVDATGAMLLKQSRSLDLDSASDAPAGDVPVEEILQDLPVPASDKQSVE